MKILVLSALFFLSGCSTHYPSYQDYLLQKNVKNMEENYFDHCHAYGCKHVSSVNLTENDWREIDAVFADKTATPAEERKKVAQAVGLFEQIAGAQIGTEEDVRGTFFALGHMQHDCVDESTNTTVYLALLQKRGHLLHHDIAAPQARFPIIHAGRWPHQTAVITERYSGEIFAVDSWFHDNGAPAEIVELALWKEGWKPEDNNDNLSR